MDAIEHLEECKWEHPPSYGGYSPDGDYAIYARSRDDEILGNVNYREILAYLESVAEKHPPPEEVEGEDYRAWVHDFRAGHWGCGWVEYIIVRADAPEEVLKAAGEVVCAMADYPVFNDSAYSEAQCEALDEHWEHLDMQDRIALCQEAGVSVFAARREELPREVFDILYDSELAH